MPALNTIAILKFSAAMLTFSVGLVVLLQNHSSNIHRSFFLATLTGSIWLLCASFICISTTDAIAMKWLATAYLFGIPYISPSVYVFTCYWIGETVTKKKWALCFGPALLFAMLMFLYPTTFCDFRHDFLGPVKHYKDTLAGRMYFAAHFSFFLLMGLLSFIKLIRTCRAPLDPASKIHTWYFLFGFFIGYTGAIDFLVAGGMNSYQLGFVSFTLFILIIATGILKHNLLDVDLWVKKASLILFIYALLLTLLLPPAFIFFQTLLIQPRENTLPFLILLSVGIGSFLSTGPFIYAYLVKDSFWLKDRVSTGLAHELKSPINAILSAAELLEANLNNGQANRDRTADYISIVQKNGHRLENYVKNLLNVAKIQDHNLRINKTRFKLRDVLQDVTNQYQTVLDEKELTLNIDIEANLEVTADREKVSQAMSNLLSNAAKFSSAGSIDVHGTRRKENVLVSVRDYGYGISKADLPHVFDRFYQGKHAAKGSGIGLTIAKAWVEAHGGKIWAESTGEGKGATVTFTLPVS